MQVTLTVDGMTCEHCEKAVKNALNDLTGVSNVTVNLDDKSVVVSYDESDITIEQMKEAVEGQGYEVEV